MLKSYSLPLALAAFAGVTWTPTSAHANPPDFSVCTHLVSGPAFHPARISQLKTRRLLRAVFRVADCARSQVVLDTEDNAPEITAALDPLVDELGARQAHLGPLDKIARSTGTWQNVWNNQPNLPAFVDRVYQVVTPRGFYWNISKTTLPNAPGQPITFLGRGRYVPNANGEIDIFFTKNLFVPGFLDLGTPVGPVAELAETGLLDNQSFGPGELQPELASGQLTTVYVDDTIRIVRGDQFGPVPTPTLFVLVRQDVVADKIFGP